MVPRRTFRFSLRTMLVVLTLAAAWLAVQAKWVRDRHAALERLDGAGYTTTGYPSYRDPPWQLRLFGERSVDGIVVHRLKDADGRKVEELKRLFPEADVSTYP